MSTIAYAQLTLGSEFPSCQSEQPSTVPFEGASGGADTREILLYKPRAQICAVCRYRARCGYEGERWLCRAREQDVREEGDDRDSRSTQI